MLIAGCGGLRRALPLPGLADLPVIKCIDLTNNNVGKVPPDLGFIDTLTTVKLEGNTFKTPRLQPLGVPTLHGWRPYSERLLLLFGRL